MVVAGAVACGILLLYGLIRLDLISQATALVNKNTPALLFFALMLTLPMVGAPLSLFIFVLGVKYGIIYGVLLLEIIMPLHILISYALARIVRHPLSRFLVNRLGYRIPEIPQNREFLFSFLFLAVPVLPYAAKNYVLPLSGVRFRYCFWLNWLVQGTISIPFVILGKSAADMNLAVFGGTLAVLAALLLLLRWMRRWYESLG
jgi:uncharacterized membrane protein YdjX (TVP38/TMEM64 family)